MKPIMPKLKNNFSEDEKLLMDYTIQEIKYKKQVKKLQWITLFLLTLIIILFAYYLINYSLKDLELKKEYGLNYYCYKCGYISGKSCSCVYLPSNVQRTEQFFIDLGENNGKSCNLPTENDFGFK